MFPNEKKVINQIVREKARQLLKDLKLYYSKLNPIERKAVKETLAGLG